MTGNYFRARNFLITMFDTRFALREKARRWRPISGLTRFFELA
jgi:hypothetical protein